MTFQNIKANQMVWFRDRFGAIHKAKANALLLFPDHVVVNYGNNGMVVNESNIVRVGKAPACR
jgi:hypothetical protein